MRNVNASHRKTARARRLAPTLAAAMMILITAADHASAATTLYWDTNGTMAGLGVGGTNNWDTTDIWNSVANGGSSGTLSGWTDNTNIAMFNGNGSSAVTLDKSISASSVQLGNGAATTTVTLSDNSGNGTGALNVASALYVGYAGGTTATLNINSGAVTANTVEIGRASTQGTLNVSGGGTLNINTQLIIADKGTNPSGTLNITGGTVNASGSVSVGAAASVNGPTSIAGTITISSGSFNATSGVTLSNSSYATGTINLDGGDFTTSAISTTAGTSILNFNGGTLHATTTANPAFLQGLTAANILAGGAIIDSNNKNITIAQNLLSGAATDGGLTKNGVGTLTLTGLNSYNGDTVVNAGTLSLANADLDDNAAVKVAAGAFLDLTSGAIDTIGALYYNGSSLGPGVYTALSNPEFITGTSTGSLRVLGVTAPVPTALPAGLVLLGIVGAKRRPRR